MKMHPNDIKNIKIKINFCGKNSRNFFSSMRNYYYKL